MENYVMINGTKFPLTPEQLQKIMEDQKQKAETVVLRDLEPGDIFKIGNEEFMVLEQDADTSAVIKKNLLGKDMRFGDSNNYAESKILAVCEKFAESIAEQIGGENILEHTVDLTSNDGLKDYGDVKVRASLLTADRYRKYVKILDAEKLTKWWWLATPWSTQTHGIEYTVLCVAPSGYIISVTATTSAASARFAS